MKKLPIGISTFKKLIVEGYVYVDKTQYISQLVESGVYYFLSRPRRFGKSLFIDTLKECFEGNKKLFTGLYIEDKWDWGKKYPVIHISFAEGKHTERAELDKWILTLLQRNEERLGVACKDTGFIPAYFSELIEKTKQHYGLPVVILIDEYDKPMLDNITDSALACSMRDGLQNFYSVIKGQDANIKFVFMTGVSKFSKVSIFSGLNNLEDITLDKRYNAICGYTHDDIHAYFTDYVDNKAIEDVKKWYNGYSWTGTEKVYNPFSVLNYCAKGEFKNYWFETGTPAFLIQLLKEKRYYIPQLENIEAGESLIGSFDVDFIEVENLLFQTGYLTITGERTIGNKIFYTLQYPNIEVRQSLTDYMLNYYSAESGVKETNQTVLFEALTHSDLEKITAIMQSHFTSIPYEWYVKNEIDKYEGYYASVFYSYFASLGLDIRVEDSSSKGKVDMAVIMNDAVYIFEFKVIESEKEVGKALKQIKEKGYAQKYTVFGKPIYLVGIEFDKKERNIKYFEWGGNYRD